VTLALPTTAPVESVTVPVMPLSAWADAAEAHRKIRQAASAGGSQYLESLAESFSENGAVLILYLVAK
jgi:hypothetical protein